MRWTAELRRRVRRVALLVSKYDHCLHDLLWRHRAGELACEVPLIVSNHPDHEPVAAQYGVPFHVFPITKENTQPSKSRAAGAARSASASI